MLSNLTPTRTSVTLGSFTRPVIGIDELVVAKLATGAVISVLTSVFLATLKANTGVLVEASDCPAPVETAKVDVYAPIFVVSGILFLNVVTLTVLLYSSAKYKTVPI